MGVLRGLFVRKDSTKGTGPRDARMALAGLLAPSSAIGARAGVLAGPGNPVSVTGTSGWQYSVAGGQVVTSRSDSQGPVLFALDGPTPTTAVQPAPASGSRWDLIYVQHKDIDQGDGDSAASVGVVSGAAAGSPVRPSSSVPAGALVVAEALVAAGATSTQHANVTITRTVPFTAARGGLLVVRNQAERDAIAAYDGLLIASIDTGDLEVRQGAWRGVQTRVLSSDAGWPRALSGITSATPEANTVADRITIPTARYARRVTISSTVHVLPPTAGAGIQLILRNGGLGIGRASKTFAAAGVGETITATGYLELAAGASAVLEPRLSGASAGSWSTRVDFNNTTTTAVVAPA